MSDPAIERSPRPLFQLRPRHLAGIEEGRRRDFEQRVFERVCQQFRGSRAIADAQLRAMVERAAVRGRELGVRTERDLCKYIGLSFAFGEGFEHDPRYPWATAIVGRETIAASGASTVDLLCAAATQATASMEAR